MIVNMPSPDGYRLTTMSNSADRVEMFARIQRRRGYSAQQNLAFVQEAAQPGMMISHVAVLTI